MGFTRRLIPQSAYGGERGSRDELDGRAAKRGLFQDWRAFAPWWGQLLRKLLGSNGAMSLGLRRFRGPETEG
jgi:hypothetical protein